MNWLKEKLFKGLDFSDWLWAKKVRITYWALSTLWHSRKQRKRVRQTPLVKR